MQVLTPKQVEVTKVEKIICNRCGKEIDSMKVGYFTGSAVWGFLSSKDNTHSAFDLCEGCFDVITNDFVIPPTN
jgi:hypothetical protein